MDGFPFPVSGPEESAPGVLTWRTVSPFQPGPCRIRIVPPDPPPAGPVRVLILLPVEAFPETVYGDAVEAALACGIHRKHRCAVAAPSFGNLPWYADHPADPAIRQESHMIRVVLPLLRRLFPGAPPPDLAGFSKSGWGALSLLLRRPDLFRAAAAWDAPLMKSAPDDFGMGPIFGSEENFRRYEIARLAKDRAALFRGARRIGLFGYDAFREDMRAAHRLLESLSVPHDYADGPPRPHRWDGSWLEEAAAALRAMADPAA